MLRKNHKTRRFKRAAAGLALAGAALAGAGTVAAQSRYAAQPSAAPASWLAPVLTRPAAPRKARSQPQRRRRARPRATISLYEHTTALAALRAQGCRAAKRGVGGIVILDFGRPAYNGHTYGTVLFSGRFAGNHRITQAMYGYAVGYHRCLRRGSALQITLARGTSNYDPLVPSVYRAGRKWARETLRLQHRLSAHASLAAHVAAAAADDVEPAWDRSFHRTHDFFRGYRDARTGHTLYNFGSLDGGVGGIWSARQAFFVASGMKDAQVIPEIYNHAMAREWAELAHIARRRYHRPVRFAGVMTTRTSSNHGLKPRDAHTTLVRELASRIGSSAPDVPATLTNIRSAE
jgi:hypothetical protein